MPSYQELLDEWDAITSHLNREERHQLIEAMLKSKAFEPVEQLFFAKGWLA